MSIIQAHIFAHHIKVVTDTATEWRAVDPDAGRVGMTSTSKLAIVPHMPAVLAARGHTTLPQCFIGAMLLTPDLDRFMRDFADLAAGLTDRLAQMAPQHAPALDAEAELVVAGWSPGAGRLRAWHAMKPAGGSFTVSEIQGDCYAPPPYADGTTPLTPGSTDQHVAIARRQVERMRSESDGVAGGDLTIATLTRDAVNVEIIRGFMGEPAGARHTGEAAPAGA